MHYHITHDTTHNLGSIPNDSGVVIANITVDTHTTNTTLDQAIHHLYPEALLSGSGTYTREAFLEAINLLGASITVSITNAKLTISLKSTSVVFPKLLTLLQTMLTTPTFKTAELTRIKRIVSNELHIKKENSAVQAQDTFLNALYGKADRRHTSEDTEIVTAFKTVHTAALKKYHEQVMSFRWSCSILGSDDLIKKFSHLLIALKKGKENTISVPLSEQITPDKRLYLQEIPGRSNIDFSIGTPIPITLNHPDYIPLTFALGVLAIPGFAGRLMNTVRDKEGLTYGIYGYLESFSTHEPGHIRIATFFNPTQTAQGLTSTFREIKKFHERGITPAEFNRFQTIFTTKQVLLDDSLKRQLAELHSFVVQGFTVEEITAFKEILKTVTRKQVNQVISKYFKPERFVISGAGPVSKIGCDSSELLATL